MTDDEPELELDPEAVVQVEPRSPEPRGGATVSGLPFPSSTDPLMDGAAAIQNLATALEARVGLPTLADCNVVAHGFSTGLVTPSTLNSPFPGGWGAMTTEYSDGSAIIQHAYQWGANTGNELTRTRDGATWGTWHPVAPAATQVYQQANQPAGILNWAAPGTNRLGAWSAAEPYKLTAPFPGVYRVAFSGRTEGAADHFIHYTYAGNVYKCFEMFGINGTIGGIVRLDEGQYVYATVGAQLLPGTGVGATYPPALFELEYLHPT